MRLAVVFQRQQDVGLAYLPCSMRESVMHPAPHRPDCWPSIPDCSCCA